MPGREQEPFDALRRPAAMPPAPAMPARAPADPAARALLWAQQSAGNAAVLRLLAREPATDAPAGVQHLIAEDGDAAAGQLGKTEFLELLDTALCAAAESAFAGSPWTAAGCPWIAHWIAQYQRREAADVERAALRFAPAAAGAASARELIPILSARLAAGITEWRATGQWGDAVAKAELGSMPEITMPAPDADAVAAKPLDGGSAATEDADPRDLRHRLGQGLPLDGTVRARLGGAFGHDFAHVRVHTDQHAARAAADMGARAFTVGEHVAFGAGEYEPGTPIGDALIAHELTHVLQQGSGARTEARGQGGGAYDALEEDADRSAVQAVVALWSGGTGALQGIAASALPRLRTGLRLQSCRGCTTETQPLIDRLRAIGDPASLEAQLRDLTDAQINELRPQAPEGSLLAEGLGWEAALRARQWQRLADRHRADRHRLFEAYRTRVVDTVVANQTTVRIEGTDRAFASWVEGQLLEVTHGPVGFRLIVELLATGQPVSLRPTTGENTTSRRFTEQDPDAGRWVTTDADGNLLPVAQQHAGHGTGSDVSLNTRAADNQVTLGGTPTAPQVIDADATATFAHELIHALHNARGENTAPTLSPALMRGAGGYGLVRDPFTGESDSPEELRTITGQRRFGAPQEARGTPSWATEFNLPDDGISENAIRAEHNLPARGAHMGATRSLSLPVRATDTADVILDRYRTRGGGTLPPALRAAVRQILVSPDWYPRLAAGPAGVDMDLPVPHPQYVTMHLRFIAHQPALADAAEGMTVQGAR